jgi:hypothetical protein
MLIPIGTPPMPLARVAVVVKFSGVVPAGGSTFTPSDPRTAPNACYSIRTKMRWIVA